MGVVATSASGAAAIAGEASAIDGIVSQVPACERAAQVPSSGDKRSSMADADRESPR